jgi:hypothetical protein
MLGYNKRKGRAREGPAEIAPRLQEAGDEVMAMNAKDLVR